jgi:hypothetical protein
MTPTERIKAHIERLERQESSEWAVRSGCTDYACYCHFKLPPLMSALSFAVEALEDMLRTQHRGLLYHKVLVHDRCAKALWSIAALLEPGGEK